jgi:hypothetical protein
MMPKSISLVVIAIVAALAGCGSSPKSSFYTLNAAAPARQSDSAAAYTIAIAAVMVPDVVDRPQLVTRTGANELTINEFARWGEPLKSEIPRVIAADLARELEGAFVSIYPQSSAGNADYRIQLDVRRFDSTLGEAAMVEVVWTVRPLKGAAVNGRSIAREPASGAGYDALVTAHSRALASVSGEIAAAVRTMRAKQ